VRLSEQRRSDRLLGLWRQVWASPASLLGLAASLASLALPRCEGSVAVCRSSRGFAHWFLDRRGYCAVTLGHIILVTPKAPPDVLDHELVHVRQVECWGPLFIPVYLLAMFTTRLRGLDPYWDNPFEVEAREHEGADPARR